VFRCVLGSEGCVLVPRSSGTSVATWAWPTWVVSRRRVLIVVFILLEFPSPSRRIFIGSHSLPLSGSPYRSFKLDELKWKAQRRMNRCPIIYMRRMSSVASKFEMDRRMDQRYMHRFVQRPRVWLQYGSRLCASAPDDPMPWPSLHPTVAFKSNRDAPRLSTGWTDAWMEETISSSDSLIQIKQNRPKCGAFSTGWSDGASVYSVGALSGFQGSTAILARISDRMMRRSAGGTIGSSDGTTFSGNLF
jgi:hypothetical protein